MQDNAYAIYARDGSFHAEGLPDLDACAAMFTTLAGLKAFAGEEWIVVAPDGRIMTEINGAYEHDDGFVYRDPDDMLDLFDHMALPPEPDLTADEIETLAAIGIKPAREDLS